MLDLCSLPPQALLVIFNQLNQHQVLKLAPMHSILAPVAKAKLYSHLYVYPSSQLGAKINSLGCLEPEFRFHKNLNNLKSYGYTIISMNTLEKYLATMDRYQPITRFEFVVCHLIIFECVIRHFHSIKFFALNQSLVSEYYFTVYFDYQIIQYLKMLGLNTIHICPRTRGVIFDNESRTSELTIEYMSYILEFVDQLPCLTSLNVERTDLGLDYQSKLKLQTLRLFDVTIEFNLIERTFTTRFLKELFVAGSFPLYKIVSSRNLHDEFPSLVQLCVLLYEDSVQNVQRLALLSHKSLQGIIIHTIGFNAAYAKAICKLRSGFPLASINWLFQPTMWCLKSLIYELVSVCSPKLPLSYVAVHFNPEYELSLPQGGFEILDANGRSMHMRLCEYYTHWELKQIFHLIKRK